MHQDTVWRLDSSGKLLRKFLLLVIILALSLNVELLVLLPMAHYKHCASVLYKLIHWLNSTEYQADMSHSPVVSMRVSDIEIQRASAYL